MHWYSSLTNNRAAPGIGILILICLLYVMAGLLLCLASRLQHILIPQEAPQTLNDEQPQPDQESHDHFPQERGELQRTGLLHEHHPLHFVGPLQARQTLNDGQPQPDQEHHEHFPQERRELQRIGLLHEHHPLRILGPLRACQTLNGGLPQPDQERRDRFSQERELRRIILLHALRQLMEQLEGDRNRIASDSDHNQP